MENSITFSSEVWSKEISGFLKAAGIAHKLEGKTIKYSTKDLAKVHDTIAKRVPAETYNKWNWTI